MRTFLATVLLLLALATPARGQFLIDPYRYYQVAHTAVFDGTNDFARFSTSLTGVANSKTFTMAFWIRIDGTDPAGKFYRIWFLQTLTDPNLWLTRAVSPVHTLSIQARNAANTTILNADTSKLLTTTNGWTHIYLAIDLANSSNRHIYFDGVEDSSVTWTTYTDDTIELTNGGGVSTTIGADASNLGPLEGALAEFWFDDTYFNDPTKFISGGYPVPLGANGQLPTGSAPVLYLSRAGSGNTWATDSSGNGNNFTVTGSLGSTTTPP